MIRILPCPSAGSATCWRSAGLPPPGSGQRGRSPADGADRPPVPGAALLWLAPHGGLATQGFAVNRKRVQRLMRLMGLIYQRPNTSKAAPEHTKYPYLLGGLTIDRVNQVWCTDITYIPLAKGFIYLVAIMDWHSRAVLAWRLSNTVPSRHHLPSCKDLQDHCTVDSSSRCPEMIPPVVANASCVFNKIGEGLRCPER